MHHCLQTIINRFQPQPPLPGSEELREMNRFWGAQWDKLVHSEPPSCMFLSRYTVLCFFVNPPNEPISTSYIKGQMIQPSIPEERRANGIKQPVVLYSGLFRASSSAADRCWPCVCVPLFPVHFHHRPLNSDRVPLTSALSFPLSFACFHRPAAGLISL